MYIYIYIYIYLSSLVHKQGVTQGQFLGALWFSGNDTWYILCYIFE